MPAASGSTNQRLTSVCPAPMPTVSVIVRKAGAAASPVAVDAQLFPHLAPGGLGRVLVRLDVAAGRQPQPGVDVVDQEHLAVGGIDRHHVRHQVPRWGRGLDPAEDVIGARKPAQRLRPMGGFEVVGGDEPGDEVMDGGDGGTHARASSHHRPTPFIHMFYPQGVDSPCGLARVACDRYGQAMTTPDFTKPFVLPVPAATVERIGNVDLYLPVATGPAPAIVLVHGGPLPAALRPVPATGPSSRGTRRSPPTRAPSG